MRIEVKEQVRVAVERGKHLLERGTYSEEQFVAYLFGLQAGLEAAGVTKGMEAADLITKYLEEK